MEAICRARSCRFFTGTVQDLAAPPEPTVDAEIQGHICASHAAPWPGQRCEVVCKSRLRIRVPTRVTHRHQVGPRRTWRGSGGDRSPSTKPRKGRTRDRRAAAEARSIASSSADARASKTPGTVSARSRSSGCTASLERGEERGHPCGMPAAARKNGSCGAAPWRWILPPRWVASTKRRTSPERPWRCNAVAIAERANVGKAAATSKETSSGSSGRCARGGVHIERVLRGGATREESPLSGGVPGGGRRGDRSDHHAAQTLDVCVLEPQRVGGSWRAFRSGGARWRDIFGDAYECRIIEAARGGRLRLPSDGRALQACERRRCQPRPKRQPVCHPSRGRLLALCRGPPGLPSV